MLHKVCVFTGTHSRGKHRSQHVQRAGEASQPGLEPELRKGQEGGTVHGEADKGPGMLHPG